MYGIYRVCISHSTYIAFSFRLPRNIPEASDILLFYSTKITLKFFFRRLQHVLWKLSLWDCSSPKDVCCAVLCIYKNVSNLKSEIDIRQIKIEKQRTYLVSWGYEWSKSLWDFSYFLYVIKTYWIDQPSNKRYI